MEVTTMRIFALLVGVLLFAVTTGLGTAAPLTPKFATGAEEVSGFVLVQQKKSDTVTQRVKRAWKDLVGYKFDVGCPVFFPVNRRTCTETGKDRSEARAKCAAQNQFCLISDAR
jgi:hypothetical protein